MCRGEERGWGMQRVEVGGGERQNMFKWSRSFLEIHREN